MPLVDGGDVTNLITSFLEEPNHSYSSGGQILLAQTFPLWEPTYLYLAVIRTYAPLPGRTQFLDIRAIDWQGKPTGGNLASKLYENSNEILAFPGTWKLFQYSPVPYLDPGGYCLVFSTPGMPDYTGAAWTAQQSQDPYPLGKAWLSVDNGLTWERINYEAFLFQVWGWSPPPVAPVAPTVGNWAVLSIMFNELADGFEVIATTDIPCHLFMRWSTTIPLKHAKGKVVRGLHVMSGTRYCFVAWEENEQLELGDTYIHTFIKPNWPVCQTRWFYFTGTKQAEEMPSSTAVFWYHREQTAFIQYFKEPWTTEIPPPPTMVIIFEEPWTYLTPPPPEMAQLFYEPWSYVPTPPFADWIFWEPWGTYLDQYNNWSYLNAPPQCQVSFDAGIITITNPGYHDTGIAYYPPIHYPIVDAHGYAINVFMNNPQAGANHASSNIAFAGFFRHPTERTLYFQLMLAYGEISGAACPFGVQEALMWDRVWQCVGLGQLTIDLYDLWKRARIALGKSIDPEGWTLDAFHFGLHLDDPTVTDWLKNDYIGIYYSGKVLKFSEPWTS